MSKEHTTFTGKILRVLGWIFVLWVGAAGALAFCSLLSDYLSRGILFLSLRHFLACFASLLPAFIMLLVGIFGIQALMKR